MADLFEQRPVNKRKESRVGFWATLEEKSEVERLARDAGHGTVSDYLRSP